MPKKRGHGDHVINPNVKVTLRGIGEKKQSNNIKLTINKLVELWAGVGRKKYRIEPKDLFPTAPKHFSRFVCEKFIVYMLLKNILVEEFHNTPYSTLSYLMPNFDSPFVLKIFSTKNANGLSFVLPKLCDDSSATKANKGVANKKMKRAVVDTLDCIDKIQLTTPKKRRARKRSSSKETSKKSPIKRKRAVKNSKKGQLEFDVIPKKRKTK